MRHLTYILTLFCFSGLLLSCQQTAPPRLEYAKSFEEIAHLAAAEGKHFAIVLASPDCPACQILYLRLHNKTRSVISKDIIFNIIDVTLPQNRWYSQLIQSGARPTTLVFCPDAQLQAIIQGASHSGIDCLKNVLNGNIDCAPFYNNIPFPESVSYNDMIRTLNLILTAKHKIERGEDAVEKLEKALTILYYPFPLWLKIQNEYNLGYTEDAIMWARQMLTFQSPLHTRLYSDLFLAARKVINPYFDIATMPTLAVETNRVYLGELQKGDEMDFRITLTNTGKEPLLIHHIDVGCSCLELQNNIPREIAPNQEIYLHLLFTAERQGEIRRNVRITNNGLTAVETIAIRANVL